VDGGFIVEKVRLCLLASLKRPSIPRDLLAIAAVTRS
jgi:hypothetical protein